MAPKAIFNGDRVTMGAGAEGRQPLGSGRLKSWQAYVFAIAATAASIALRFVLDGELEGRPTVVIFALPIMLSAYVGGLRAGSLATGLACLFTTYYLYPPTHSFLVASTADRWQLFLVMLAGVVISALNEALHRARRRAAIAIREHQQAEEDRKRFFALSQDMLCILGFDGYFKDVNPAWEKTLGYPKAELLATPSIEFIHPDDREATLAEAERVSGGKALIAFENRYRCKDGSYRLFQWSVTPVIEDRVMYGVAHDITERKRTEVQIHQLNAELEQRVIERTSQLEAANQELEAFSYSVSHDLRAPLRGVDGYIRMLKEDCAGQLDSEGNRLLEVVSSEAKRMGRLIDDLLAFSRLGREQMDSTTIDMTALARGVFEIPLRAEPESAPRFELKALPLAQGDASMLRQVFVNLIGNAVKFTRHQSAPVVEVGGRSGDGEMTYYVKDNGVGFDEKYGHKLFGVFQRLHSEEEFEGTGVGLALVQRVIHRHGGRVWAEGKPNQGATFYFTLPIRKELANEPSR